MTRRSFAPSFAVLSLVTFSACSFLACIEDKARAPAAEGCNTPGCANPGVIGGGDSGTPDVDRGDAVDSDAASDASVTATVLVRPVSKFTADFTTTAEASRTVTLSAPKTGGGVTEASPAIDGTFTLIDVAAAVGAPTWLQVVSGTGVTRAVKGIDGVPLPSSGILQIPLFDDSLPQTTWLTLGVSAPYPTTAATVVVHVFDAAGVRKSGVTASPFGDAKGPFYDDGSDISASAKATGARGTLVYLGIGATGLFTLTTAAGGKTYASIAIPLAAGAVSHLSLQLE